MNNGTKKIISELKGLISFLQEIEDENKSKELIIRLSPLISWMNKFESMNEHFQKDYSIYKKLYKDSKNNTIHFNLTFEIIYEKIIFNLKYLAASTDKDIDKVFIANIKELLTKKCS